MEVFRLNSCSKCGGALFLDRDQYGPRLTCCSCGWQQDLVIDRPLPKVYDADPEQVSVADGCAVSSSCFTCPLEDCLWESPTARLTYLWDKSALALFERYKQLGTAKAAAATAKELTVSERRIYRALKRQRPAA